MVVAEMPMRIRVECHAGYRGEEEPRAFWLGERRLEVIELVDRWLAPEHRYFKVKASDGDFYILRHDELRRLWELGAFTRAQTTAPIADVTREAHAPSRDDPGKPGSNR